MAILVPGWMPRCSRSHLVTVNWPLLLIETVRVLDFIVHRSVDELPSLSERAERPSILSDHRRQAPLSAPGLSGRDHSVSRALPGPFVTAPYRLTRAQDHESREAENRHERRRKNYLVRRIIGYHRMQYPQVPRLGTTHPSLTSSIPTETPSEGSRATTPNLSVTF